MIHVTEHALRRYNERIAAVGIGEARRRILLHETAIEIAGRFGAPVVKNGDGVRFVVKRARPNAESRTKRTMVVTVLSRDMPLGRSQ